MSKGLGNRHSVGVHDLFLAPANLWWDAAKGYVSFGHMPPGVDIEAAFGSDDHVRTV